MGSPRVEHLKSDVVFTGARAWEISPLVMSFHYSRRMPANIQHCYVARTPGGLFGETGQVRAGVIFSIPPTRWSEPVIELSRLVREPEFDGPLSQLIGFACRRLAGNGWGLAISFADWTEKHHGGVYQAAGWNYDGCREKRMDGLVIDGVFKPGRSCNNTWGTQSPSRLRDILTHAEIEPHFDDGKHLYWRPLTVAGKGKARRLGLKRLAYPKPNAAGPPDERASNPRERGATPRGRSKSLEL